MYYWVRPTADISQEFPNFPKDWKLEHANANSSNQHRLNISTRSAFRNLRVTGYIANISDSPQSRNASTKAGLSDSLNKFCLGFNFLERVKQFTVVIRIYYPTPGNAEESFFWARAFCFSNQFCPKVSPHPEAQHGIMVGDPVEGLLAPFQGKVVI